MSLWNMKKIITEMRGGSSEDDFYKEIMLVAENDGDSYRKKDAKGAIEKAIKQIRRYLMEDFDEEAKKVKASLVKDLSKEWSRHWK